MALCDSTYQIYTCVHQKAFFCRELSYWLLLIAQMQSILRLCVQGVLTRCLYFWLPFMEACCHTDTNNNFPLICRCCMFHRQMWKGGMRYYAYIHGKWNWGRMLTFGRSRSVPSCSLVLILKAFAGKLEWQHWGKISQQVSFVTHTSRLPDVHWDLPLQKQ